MNKTTNKFFPEVRARAVRMVLDHEGEHPFVHELCHMHHLDYTDAFWNEVDKVMPNYAERKEWLRVNGAGLDV